MQNELKPCPFCGGEAIIVTLRMPDNGEEKQHYGNCKKCNANSSWNLDKEKAINSWNNRINDTHEEIERLKEVNEKQRLIIESVDDNMYPLPFETDYDKAIKTAKAEAYKEFAERVKLEFYYEFDELIPSIMADKIDNLLKELVGDE